MHPLDAIGSQDSPLASLFQVMLSKKMIDAIYSNLPHTRGIADDMIVWGENQTSQTMIRHLTDLCN